MPVYDAGEADGTLFIAMRYVDGTDLRRLLGGEGPLAPERAVAVAAQVAARWTRRTRDGLVHRDVKPSNVLIDHADGREHCYLADFGLTQSVATVRPPTASSWARWTTSHPSRSAAIRSTAAPTCTRSAACSTRR